MRLALLALIFPCLVAAQQKPGPGKAAEFPLAEAVEQHPRSGLPNFFAKAATPGAKVKIAYFGGSITAQPGWRVKSLAHLAQTYPQASFSEVNAAIGGTGSDLGVHRLATDVLSHKPDLIFVEFAVNDGGTDPLQIQRCMEGIVRQTWATLPSCDLCFVYTLTEALAPAMLDGHYQRSASAMELVAQHYGIPSIHMAMEVASLAKSKKLVWSGPLPKTETEKQAAGDRLVFAPDSVHPHIKTGHQLYLAAIQRSLPVIAAVSKEPASHALPTALIASHYQSAKAIALGPDSGIQLSAGFSKVDPSKDSFAKHLSVRLPAMMKATQAGETLRFKFKGTRAAIYHVVGPDSGQVTVTVDGDSKVQSCFDPYCAYYRLNTLTIGVDLPDTLHDVVVTLHPDQPNKAALLAKTKRKIDDPKPYAGLGFYPGALLLVGDLIP
jgi:lysophospholipase L1-like esterase